MSGALIQHDCHPGSKVVSEVIERGETDCKDVVFVAQRLGQVTGEESLSDDRDRVEEVIKE